MNCRNDILDFCNSVEVKSAVSSEVELAVSGELEAALSSEVESAVSSAECQLCAAAYERDGGCKYALRGKWFKMIMPDECYLKAHTKSQMNCRNDILDFCNSVEVKSAVSSEVELAVSGELEAALSSEVESAVSSAECQLCAAAYERDGGCKYALRGKWFKMIMPDECYLKPHTKSQMNCRNDILDF